MFYSFQFGYGEFRINEFRTRNQIARSGVAPDYGCFETTFFFLFFTFFFLFMFFDSFFDDIHRAFVARLGL